MTTAHRPTWNSVKGTSEPGKNRMVVPSRQYSARDLPGQLVMKERPKVVVEDVNKYENKLKEDEEKYFAQKNLTKRHAIAQNDEEPPIQKILKGESVSPSKDAVILEKKPLEQASSSTSYVNPFPQDRDEDDFKESDNDDDNESENKSKSGEESEEDDEDETSKLFAEYERIKKEREEEQKKKAQEREKELQNEVDEEIMKSNPLISGTSYSLTKRWYEDTVFKNQAKTEPKEKKRFINDTVRSDFHRKFLTRYIMN